MPFAKSKPMEAYEPGKCPKCGAAIQMHLKRTVSAFVRWRTDVTRANARSSTHDSGIHSNWRGQ